MANQQKFSIGDKVYEKDNTIETIVVGTYGAWVLVLVLPGMNEQDSSEILPGESYYLVGTAIDTTYIGRQGAWKDYKDLVSVPDGKKAPEVPKGPDGCACIRCTKFCGMSANNLSNKKDLEDPELRPSQVKKAFACYTCRSTLGWWLESQGWVET